MPLSVVAGGGVFDKQGKVHLHNGTPPKMEIEVEDEEGGKRFVLVAFFCVGFSNM